MRPGKSKSHCPKRGLSFDPQSGREQSGIRPALTLSPYTYNLKTNLALFCPITSQIKNYPFEVLVENKKIKGVVLSDNIKSLDWKKRKAKKIMLVDEEVMKEVLGKVRLLME